MKLYGLKRRRVYCRTCGATAGHPRAEGDVDVALATTALRLFSRYDAVVLSAGDGDFEDFVRYIVEDHDKRFYIAAFDGSISPDLQQFSAENYLLDEHYADVCDDRCFEEPFDGWTTWTASSCRCERLSPRPMPPAASPGRYCRSASMRGVCLRLHMCAAGEGARPDAHALHSALSPSNVPP